MEGKKSKRGIISDGRPTKSTPEVVAKIAEAVASGLTDEEASLLAGVNPDTMTECENDGAIMAKFWDVPIAPAAEWLPLFSTPRPVRLNRRV
jgi:hypothetical protein